MASIIESFNKEDIHSRQDGADDIYTVWVCDTFLRILVWKMDSTFYCYILWVSNLINFV